MPKRQKEYQLYNKNLSIHTKITYFAGWVVVFILGYLGLRHIGDVDIVGRKFGWISLIEAGMALIALLLTDAIRGHGIFPTPYRQPHKNLFQRVIAIFFLIAVIQFVFQMIPLTFREWEKGLAVVSVSVSEELFFRGFLISIFVSIGHNDFTKIKLSKNKQISFTEILGIFLSSIAFAILHINYWNDISLMMTVFIGGLILGSLYWWWRDLTSVVLAHFLLNLIVTIQSMFILNL